MPRAALWGCGLLAAAIGVAVAWPPRHGPEPPALRAPADRPATAAADPGAEHVDLVDRIAAVGASLVPLADQFGFEVRDERGAPVGGASLHIGVGPPESLRGDPGLADASVATLPGIVVLHTAADGRVWWTSQDQTGLEVRVEARHGSRWALCRLAATALRGPDHVHVLTLQADRSLSVRVHHADGRPVGQQAVTLAAARRNGFRDTLDTVATATTGADGVAHFEHVQLWLPRVMPDGESTRLLAATTIPGAEVECVFDPDGGTAPILTLPPVGSIDAVLQDPAGRPMPRGTPVFLFEPDAIRRSYLAVTTPGRARFEHVAVGRRFRLAALSPWVAFDGPAVAGTTTAVLVRCHPVVRVSGRAVLAGTPLTQRTLRSRLDAVQSVHTDASGSFTVLLPPSRLGTVLGETPFTIDEPGAPRLRASWRGQVTLSAGDHDLGTLEFAVDAPAKAAPQPRLVAGRLVAAPGDRDLSEVRLELCGHDGSPIVGSPAEPVLERNHADGSFVFRGAAPSAALAIRVDSQRHLPVPLVPVTAGQTDVRIELDRGCTVRATLTGQAATLQCLLPQLKPLDAQRHRDDRSGGHPSELRSTGRDLVVSWHRQAPGPYRLHLEVAGQPQPIASRDLVVPAGAREIDIQPTIEVPTLTVVRLRPRLASPRDAYAVVAFADGKTRQCQQELDGSFRIAAAAPFDVLLRARRCRDRRLQGVFEDREVDFEPGIGVTVHCRIANLPEGADWSLDLVGDCLVTGLMGSDSHSGMGDGATRVFYVPEPGSYMLHGHGGDAAGRIFTLFPDPNWLRVPNGGGTFVVEATIEYDG
ncbi:MAG: hypothetical protein JNL08_09515 [Planctomycetes bacterium]|nr:hypothetical protein [Planctomycetota bacterium]